MQTIALARFTPPSHEAEGEQSSNHRLRVAQFLTSRGDAMHPHPVGFSGQVAFLIDDAMAVLSMGLR